MPTSLMVPNFKITRRIVYKRLRHVVYPLGPAAAASQSEDECVQRILFFLDMNDPSRPGQPACRPVSGSHDLRNGYTAPLSEGQGSVFCANMYTPGICCIHVLGSRGRGVCISIGPADWKALAALQQEGEGLLVLNDETSILSGRLRRPKGGGRLPSWLECLRRSGF